MCFSLFFKSSDFHAYYFGNKEKLNPHNTPQHESLYDGFMFHTIKDVGLGLEKTLTLLAISCSNRCSTQNSISSENIIKEKR